MNKYSGFTIIVKKINLFSTFDKKFDFFKKLNQPCYKISQVYFMTTI